MKRYKTESIVIIKYTKNKIIIYSTNHNGKWNSNIYEMIYNFKGFHTISMATIFLKKSSFVWECNLWQVKVHKIFWFIFSNSHTFAYINIKYLVTKRKNLFHSHETFLSNIFYIPREPPHICIESNDILDMHYKNLFLKNMLLSSNN